MVLLKKWYLLATAIVGIILVVLGVVWMTAIFPALAKMPADYEREIYFDGNFNVFDLATQQLQEIPIVMVRDHKAIGVEGNALLIKEVVTVTHAQDGTDLSERYGSEDDLAVDRSTRQHVPGLGDMDREGGFGFPAWVSKEQSYPVWNPKAVASMDAHFVAEEEFRGLKVLVFQIDEKDIVAPASEQMPIEGTMDTTIVFRVEPVTGVTITNDSLTTVRVPMMGEDPIFIGTTTFAEETIAELMDLAGSNRTKLLWFRTYLPWLVIGLGIIALVAVAIVVAITARQKP